MSTSSKPRVVRKNKPTKIYTKSNYRKALPMLLEDFDNRCAYSMVHVARVGETAMHVDHFDPRKKRRSKYSNLFPAYSSVNIAKGESPVESEFGTRLLNPCEETDYGEQIFEDPNTHVLVGTSANARYHITILRLNDPHLVLARKERATHRALLKQCPILVKGGFSEAASKLAELEEILRTHIPDIPPPPHAQGS